MNVKFSPESVRMRVSLSEARTLAEKCILTQEVPGILNMKVCIADNAESVFSLIDEDLKVLINKKDFLDLLSERPSRDSLLKFPLNDEGLDFIFEIDLFSRKKQ